MIARLLSSLALGFGLIAIGGATAPASAQACPCDFEALMPSDHSERAFQCIGGLGAKSARILTYQQNKGKQQNWSADVGAASGASVGVCQVRHFVQNLRNGRTREINKDKTILETLLPNEHNACLDSLADFARDNSPEAVLVHPVMSANKFSTMAEHAGCPTNAISETRCIIAWNACDPLTSVTEWAEANAPEEVAVLNDFPRDSDYLP